jgi:NAD(P)-dependent dehydrogenase (short-subunit alcohol dehydrogenase family)
MTTPHDENIGWPRPEYSCAGSTAIVIGAARGIGASIARELLRAGAAVVAVDVSPTVVDLVGGMEAGRICAVCGDITEPSTIGTAIDEAEKLRGRPSILVHSAFAETPTALEDTSVAGWNRALDVLLTSAWRADVEFVRGLQGRPASIVHIASVHALATAPKYGAYAAAKAGLVGLTRSAAVEWGPLGVRVNAVCPGFIKVERNAFIWEDQQTFEAKLRSYPLRRVGLPEDVARAVVFLCSPAAGYITGVSLPVDGGMLALVPEAVAFGP